MKNKQANIEEKKRRSITSLMLLLCTIIFLGLLGHSLLEPQLEQLNLIDDKTSKSDASDKPLSPKKIHFQERLEGKKKDVANAIVNLTDGGYLLVGNTESYGNGQSDAWIIKLDKYGQIDWRRTYGGAQKDEANGVIITKDQHFLVVGTTQSQGNGKEDIWLLKLNSKGRKVWEKTYGTSLMDVGSAVCQMPNGNYALTGFSQMETTKKASMSVICVNPQGTLIWQQTFGGNNWDVGMGIIANKRNELTIAGHSKSFSNGNSDGWIVKLDKDGKALWKENFGGTEADIFTDIKAYKNGSYLVVGSTRSNSQGWEDVWVMKLNAQGKKRWEKRIGAAKADVAKAVVLDKKGDGYITGYTASYGAGAKDLWLLKMGSMGKLKWKKEYGSKRDDTANCIALTADNGIVAAGFSKGISEDVWVVKTDADGEF